MKFRNLLHSLGEEPPLQPFQYGLYYYYVNLCQPRGNDIITIDELKAKLGGMKTSVDDLRDALSIEASEKRLAELEHQMTLPGFYDDQAKSQKVISEMGEVKNKLERFGK